MCPPLNAQDLAFLEELERQLGQEALDQRQYERAPLRLALSMTPADTSRAGEPANLGTTLNVSVGGALAEVQSPTRVGDHYRVRLFVRKDQELDVVARCLRCSLLSESRFEIALHFIAPLMRHDLPLSYDHD
jgi:hypothetical protein